MNFLKKFCVISFHCIFISFFFIYNISMPTKQTLIEVFKHLNKIWNYLLLLYLNLS